jgi:hypothetical protein
MVATFLRGELDSPRFAADLRAELAARGLDRTLIDAPDLADPVANARREAVLLGYRPWVVQDAGGRSWQWVELTAEDVADLHYLTYSYWDELSDGTHVVRDGARNVRAGKVVFEVPNDRFWTVAGLIDAGRPMPPLIIAGGAPGTPHTLVEGHLRATGHLLAQRPPRVLKALFGNLVTLSSSGLESR